MVLCRLLKWPQKLMIAQFAKCVSKAMDRCFRIFRSAVAAAQFPKASSNSSSFLKLTASHAAGTPRSCCASATGNKYDTSGVRNTCRAGFCGTSRTSQSWCSSPWKAKCLRCATWRGELFGATSRDLGSPPTSSASKAAAASAHQAHPEAQQLRRCLNWRRRCGA